MLYYGWSYPTEQDLETEKNQAILAGIYADPTSKTTAESPAAQKQKVLHFTLVMLEGQAFGVEYQADLGAYERTASGKVQLSLSADTRDWLDLPCGSWATVRDMFLGILR
jgi:hypothetical protein